MQPVAIFHPISEQSTDNQLRRDLHLDSDDLKKMKRRSNGRLWNRDDIRSLIRFLSVDVGLSLEDSRRVMVNHPHLLSYSLSKLRGTRRIFLDDIGLSREDLARMIMKKPSVLTIRFKIRPTIEVRVLYMPECM